jgi:hypothetical protein
LQKIGRLSIASALLAAVIISTFTVVSASACEPPPPPQCNCPPGSVFYLGKDTKTQGDWRHAQQSPLGYYGTYAHIFPNPPVTGFEIPVGSFSVPVGGYTYGDYGWSWEQQMGLPYGRTDPTYWDEYASLDPKINYTLTGSLVDMLGIGLIQYPVFEWGWDNFNSSDPRAIHFEMNVPGAGGPGTRLTCWDDGAENHHANSFNVTMEFPAGCFMLSLYAYDKEIVQRPNQTIYITNEAGVVLASAMMKGTEFDGGMYLQFVVCGPTTIVVHVEKSGGSINAVLSGIFVDRFKCKHVWRCTRSECFWKTNLAKLLRYTCGSSQVSKNNMLNYIEKVADRCPSIFGYLKPLTGNARLVAAYKIFAFTGSSMLDKAKAQFFALLLNVASGKALESDVIAPYLYDKLHWKYPGLALADYPYTLQVLIDMSCENIMLGKNLEFTKDMAESLIGNNWYEAIVYTIVL